MFELLRAGEAVRGVGNRGPPRARRDGPDQSSGDGHVLRWPRSARLQEC